MRHVFNRLCLFERVPDFELTCFIHLALTIRRFGQQFGQWIWLAVQFLVVLFFMPVLYGTVGKRNDKNPTDHSFTPVFPVAVSTGSDTRDRFHQPIPVPTLQSHDRATWILFLRIVASFGVGTKVSAVGELCGTVFGTGLLDARRATGMKLF